jgi:hypothetical protein
VPAIWGGTRNANLLGRLRFGFSPPLQAGLSSKTLFHQKIMGYCAYLNPHEIDQFPKNLLVFLPITCLMFKA